MKMQILGMSDRRSGKSKAGSAYDGTSLHCVLSRCKDVVKGQGVKEIYVNHMVLTSLPNFSVGDVISVEYDDRGFIENIEVVKAAAAKTTTPTA